MSNLLHSPYCPLARRLLAQLPPDDLAALVKTATCGRIAPVDVQEACTAILLSCADVPKLLSHRKLSSSFLLQYLIREGVHVAGHVTRTQLSISVFKYWEETLQKNLDTDEKKPNMVPHTEPTLYSMANVKQEDVFEPKVKIKEEPDFFQKTSLKKEPCQDSNDCRTRQDSEQPYSEPSSSVACSSRRLNVQDNNNESTASVMSDEFGQDFCEWFYTMINRLQPCCANQPGDTLRPEVFCGNCSVEMYLVDGVNVEQCRASGSVETERTIRELLKRLGLMFMPNTKGGMQVRRSSHGMIQLFCCGTMHYNDSFVGIFEQEFGLVASPVDKSWKISYTKVNLKKLLEAYTPSLPTVEIFAIEF